MNSKKVHNTEGETIEDVRRQRDEAIARAEEAEAFASVRGGEWCAKNRAEGRGGCGACAWCCQQANQSRDELGIQLAALRERLRLAMAVVDAARRVAGAGIYGAMWAMVDDLKPALAAFDAVPCDTLEKNT
jgi:hypothetical protein